MNFMKHWVMKKKIEANLRNLRNKIKELQEWEQELSKRWVYHHRKFLTEEKKEANNKEQIKEMIKSTGGGYY